VGCNDGAIYCLNQSSGKLLWFFYQNKTEMMSSPAISNGCVYAGCNNGDIFALNESNGMELWNFTTGGWVGSSPAVVEGIVYVGSRDGDLYALNAANGAKIWSFKTGDPIESSPAVSNGVVYIASDDFFVYAVNASSGKELWQTHTGSTFSSPSISNGYVYIGSYDGWVCALNASTGAHVWSYLTPDTVISSPAVAYGCVYIGSEDNNIYCFNASTGNVIWKSPTGYWVTSSPAVAGDNVYVGSEDDNIYCLNASTGAKEWIYPTENYVESSPAIVNNTLFVGSDDFHIYALALFSSSVQTLPSSIQSALPWTTVVLDVAAFAVAVIIIFEGVVFFRSTTWGKKHTQPAGVSVKDESWLSRHVDAVCVIAIFAASMLLFVNLGSGHLVAADEQTYSQWAFHMIKTGDYMTPWAFGALFWVGKPPLTLWLMALSYQIFGVTNFAARFWSPIFGALSLVAIFFLGKKLYNRFVGFLSVIVLGTFATFYQYSRLAMTDVPLVFFFLCSVYFFVSSEKGEHANRNAALGGLFFGLALMTKQFEALLVLLIIVVYLAATTKSLRFLFTKTFTIFWGIGLLAFSPWLIYMAARFGTPFWQWYFVYDIVSRSVGVVENHAGSYLFYLNYLARNESPVWLVLLPFAMALCAFNAVAKRAKADALILFWMAIVLLVFSLAQSKLDWYIIPVLPAFAIAISSLIYLASKKTYQLLKKTPLLRGQT
jgi:outer membrane protein assembly factor BamB